MCEHAGVPNLFVALVNEEFGAENVTVQVEYNEEPSVTYSLAVLDLTMMTSSSITGFQTSTIQLQLSYNTMYRVSLMASRCGQSAVNFTHFHYGKLIIIILDEA